MRRLILTCLLILPLTASCIEYPYEAGNVQRPHHRSIERLFEGAPAALSFKRTVVLKEKTYIVEQIQFNPISARLWRPVKEGKHPAILLLPAIWGDRYMEGFARKLVQEGFICLQLPSRRYLDRVRSQDQIKVEDLAQLLRSQVIEADQFLAWLYKQPHVDTDRIGVMGISIGAIIASLLTEQNDRIQAAAYVLGGGNIAEIMAAPQGYVKRKLRERIMSENGMTEAEFKEAAVRSFKIVDPLTYAGRLDAERILMINGRFDKVIPYKNARELWQALGQPNWVVLPAGHYTASIFLRYVRHRVTDHFSDQFLKG